MRKRSALALIREGNPGHRARDRVDSGMRLEPAAPPEPSWVTVLPAVPGDTNQQAAAQRLRASAREEWRRIVPELDAQGLLATVDFAILQDHCIAFALAMECVRRISIEGLTILTQRGRHRNPATTILGQQRDRLKFTTAQIGLSPLTRDSLNPRPGVDDEDSPFD
jgi:P27 family predicted phage terminase small subunit